MEPRRDLSRVEADAEAPVEAYELPPISLPPRPRCRSCRRNDRPVFGNICGWCSARE